MIPQFYCYLNIKLPILKKEGELVTQRREFQLEMDGVVLCISPVTAAEIQAWLKRKGRLKIWEAIRTRFGGNAYSKKMQKAIFKQQFEAFKISNSEGLERDRNRFQQLLSQLDSSCADSINRNDANHMFLRSFILKSEWTSIGKLQMIAIRMKKFYKIYTGRSLPRRVSLRGWKKTHGGFDKKRGLSVSIVHNNGHCARECTGKGRTHDGKEKEILSFINIKNVGRKEKNQMGLLTMDDGIVNWGEHTKAEETNHALMAYQLKQ
ncbi:hypothetical protein Tco_0323190 [Tanacetum coccineum]|uniref:Uncharacterized protein n=1 Tax=Tanacetum coccineum TaxID=301880 RepID=A0ABQ5BV69_9ASTR